MKRRVVVAMALAGALCFVTACTNPGQAQKVLAADGYENIQITGYAFFACSEDDDFKTAFRATKTGKTVEGAVCGGLLKGSTIRITKTS